MYDKIRPLMARITSVRDDLMKLYVPVYEQMQALDGVPAESFDFDLSENLYWQVTNLGEAIDCLDEALMELSDLPKDDFEKPERSA